MTRRDGQALCLALLLAALLAFYGNDAASEGPGAQSTAREESEGSGADGRGIEANDLGLFELMVDRRAVKGLTARGQTIADAPPFTATPREDQLLLFPCTNCHDNEFVDPRVRKLEEEHDDLVFDHGGGRYWCYDACHNGTDMDNLVSLRGEAIGYDQSYELCGQCHFQRQKDWYFGGHGKRAGAWENPREIPVTYQEMAGVQREKIGVWRGKRVIHNCTDCHDAHSPAIGPFRPSPPPPVRRGLTRKPVPPVSHLQVWEKVNASGEARR